MRVSVRRRANTRVYRLGKLGLGLGFGPARVLVLLPFKLSGAVGQGCILVCMDWQDLGLIYSPVQQGYVNRIQKGMHSTGVHAAQECRVPNKDV